MNEATIKALVNEAGDKGKFFVVKFIKKDKTERTLNGRLNVHKGLAGGKATTGPEYIRIWDAHKEQYRNVNPKTIFYIKGNGVLFTRKLEKGS